MTDRVGAVGGCVETEGVGELSQIAKHRTCMLED